ncbi:hypothetical protein X963_5597 [Burkholderia pseudomallei MSHR7498]|uniref:Uncharacterized protein n=1 Tax=Burkholderia pseudomallei (strain 1106a) TaxID=357348 RepID=A3P6N4_BURP0|nr:hypothetical protein BURPS1106A_A1960 [Burkholderia pseudomallei 1106a]EBA46209.1 hypothetical protein BURPS305_1776 [Burkholderia pseudomallei 305]EEH27997.1 conserved hypothetical protein [Burkholderia pseudomallei Pakistan 9]EEP51706.1 conserved hypothetical protein [Burkholderia pseudomallei MSHR346]EES21485.1 hypothetical protein BURPS1106B_0017 [Burkholderia pseudomallei 1106b]KGS91934.1 hypothetical protein X963_5597 [Burkholderia pseudomallei MSHR7498]
MLNFVRPPVHCHMLRKFSLVSRLIRASVNSFLSDTQL